MKAQLNFDLEDPHDRLAHLRATNATNCYLAFFSIMNDVFRKRLKYATEETSEECLHLLDELRNEISNIMEEYEINLNHLE